MRLYYVPLTRANRPRWLLEELGVPYELVRLDRNKGELKTPEYRKIHPLGAVPALSDGEVTVFESAAICAYLADKFIEKKLAPPFGSPDRGAYYQWLFFAMATLEPAVAAVGYNTTLKPEAERIPKAADEGRRNFAEYAAVLEAHLAGRDYLLGDQFTAADVMVGATLVWAKNLKLLEAYGGLQAYVLRLMQRPAFLSSRKD